MVKTASNIIVGAPSTVIVSAYGIAEGSGVDLGSTEGGVKLSYNPEFYFKKADQWVGKVGAVKTNEDMTIEMVLAECTLANLAYAFGYPTGAVSTTNLYIGGSSTVTERTLYINGNATGSGTRKITVHKVVIIGATEVALLKDNKTAIKVTFQVLQDTTQTTNQQYMHVEDSSTDTTAPTIALSSPVDGGTVTKDAKTVVQWTITDDDNPIDQNTIIYGAEDNATIMIINTTVAGSASLVAGSISYNSGTKVVTFTPTSNWTASDTFQAIVTTGLRDMAGNNLATPKIEQFSATS